MKLKIISDGTTIGTKLINEETGEAIDFVQNITWNADAKNAFTTCIVEFTKLTIEVLVDVDLDDK